MPSRFLGAIPPYDRLLSRPANAELSTGVNNSGRSGAVLGHSSQDHGHLAFMLILFMIFDCPPLEHSAKEVLHKP